MCACTESDVRESATRLHSKRLINFTLDLKVRQCALLSALLTHSAIGSYTSDPRQMLFRIHAPFPVSSTVERTVLSLQFFILISGVFCISLCLCLGWGGMWCIIFPVCNAIKSAVLGNVMLCSLVSVNSAFCLLSIFIGFVWSSG
jgi:hypothetical protein